jgi:hypothetical protein
MDTQMARKTFKHTLKPAPKPAPEQEPAVVARRRRERDNAALQERKETWEKHGVRVTEAMQSARSPDIKGVRRAYRDIHSQVLQDALARLGKAF